MRLNTFGYSITRLQKSAFRGGNRPSMFWRDAGKSNAMGDTDVDEDTDVDSNS